VIDYLPSILCIVAFVLHVLGERRAVVLTGRPRDRQARWRSVSFYAGLITVLIALQSPLDSLSDSLFWAHMIQHLLLLMVAAPLIVLGRPWMSMWRPLPLGFRRTVARTALRARWMAPVRAVFGFLALPVVAWVVFNVNLIAWHLPGPYSLTLENTAVHVVEHTSFVLFGILFWAQVMACPPAPRILSYGQRILFVGSSIIPNVLLSVVLAYASHPLYGPYAQLAHRPGGITALTDQRIGAGLMWTLGDLPFVIAIAVLAARWLAANEAATARIGKVAQV
jgi:putative membrane protein